MSKKQKMLSFERKKMTTKHWVFIGIIVIFFITYGYLMSRGGNDTTDEQWLTPFLDVPEFSSLDTEGNTITNDYFSDNKITFVYIWDPTKSNCIANLNDVKGISHSLKDKGVKVLGIISNYKGNEEVAKSLISSKKLNFPNIIPDEALQKSLIDRSEYMPTSYMIDSKGQALSGDIIYDRKEGEYYDIINALLKAMERSEQ